MTGEAEAGGRGSAASGGVAALFRAFLAGFNATGEGWNGEYPFSDRGRDAATDPVVQNAFNEFFIAEARRVASELDVP